MTAPTNLQQYQAQLQANQAALGQQLLHPSQRPGQPQSSSVSIATQQQQQLMNKVMEKQQSELQLDKSRVTLLLEINAELLREVLNIQPKLKSQEEAKNDPMFRECMRRLQQNLAYLAAIADRSHKPAAHIPPCPGVLLPPPDMPALEGLYKKLQDLYPGINPANPPQHQHQQNAQLGPPRSGQNSSPKPQLPQGALHGMPPPHHGSPRDNNHLSSPPPPQMPLHQSPPPQGIQGMQLPPQHQVPLTPQQQQQQQPQHQQQPQQQQMMYPNHAHSQSPPLQDLRVQQHHQQQQHNSSSSNNNNNNSSNSNSNSSNSSSIMRNSYNNSNSNDKP
ncbi:hypothetical protein K440DRAFT_145816 [Wilcoxina mikolae CBS 423.85]|nr:hypothetical protein K440DRAFT_145816 [Wilcoxina mikolae CBS 423.85]